MPGKNRTHVSAVLIGGIVVIFIFDRLARQVALSLGSAFVTRTFVGVELPAVFVIGISAGICAVLYAWSVRASMWPRIAVFCVLLGAASNVFDRIFYGGVIDWIPVGGIVVNGADVLIASGAIGAAFFVLRA